MADTDMRESIAGEVETGQSGDYVMGDFDIPWIYVAMVAIIFVRWLLGQVKRASEVRERRRRVARRGGG